MISAWTKQFMIASGFFALLLTTVTAQLFIKEQMIVKKQLENKKSLQVSTKIKRIQENKII